MAEKEHEIYCQACNHTKLERNFYKSNSPKYAGDIYHGRAPFCKKCIKEKIYMKNGMLDKKEFLFVLKTYLDLPFFNKVFLKCLEDTRETLWAYITTLNLNAKTRNLTWIAGETEEKAEADIKVNEDNSKITEEMKMDWGKGFSYDEYEFLDNELFEWEKTYKYGKRAELILLKEICMTLLRIRKVREGDGDEDVSKLQKDLQDLLKTASIDPAKANIADNGKSLDSFGVWIKDIENKRPAEWFEEQDKYKDMDGFVKYIENYIVRPIRNFLTGNRDFQINDDIDADLDSVDVDQTDEGDNNGKL